MSRHLDHSFDASANLDLVPGINHADGMQESQLEGMEPGVKFPIKKLSEVFDACMSSKADQETMKVYLRVRPSSAGKGTSTIDVESDTSIVTQAPESSKRAQYTKMERRHYVSTLFLWIGLHQFETHITYLISFLVYPHCYIIFLEQAFTRVFGPEATQGDVFLQAAHPLFERFVGGDSSVFLAYGMTNAGKTHTIQGNKEKPGIMPLLVQEVLRHMAGSSDWDLNISMLEIYQEKIYDLLSEKKKKEKLSIRDGNGRVEVMGLSQHPISSADQAIDLMDAATSRRSITKTHLNNGSSRSHAVYSLTLSRYIGGRETKSEFQVVDLAGAERGKRTNGTTSQQREANNINMSLMQLWRCLQAMGRRGHAPSDIVPFRESKLTHLLMPLLGRVGLSGVAMVTCVNPQNDDYDETVSILGNASLACKIQEISDMGRTMTVGVVGLATQASNPLDNIRFHKQRNSSTSTNGSNGGGQSKKGSTQRNSSLMSVPETDNATGSALKRLKEEVTQMRAQNELLLREQAMREQEIREEVAEEMAIRSTHLLQQIQELQEQVSQTTTSYYNDVTKSVMKAKQRQIQKANEQIGAELQECVREMEAELLQVKETYEEEISILNKEKDELESALNDWKAKAEEAIIIAEKLNEEKLELQTKLQEMEVEANSGVLASKIKMFAENATTEEREWFESDKHSASLSVSSHSSQSNEEESEDKSATDDSEHEQPPAYDEATHNAEDDVASIVMPPPAPAIKLEAAVVGKRLLEEIPSVVESISVIIPPKRLSRNISNPADAAVEEAARIEPVNVPRASAASAFEMRMKRDQRFQKPTTTSDSVAPVVLSEAKPIRSPLAPAPANSPKAVVEIKEDKPQLTKTTIVGTKRALSPMRGHAHVTVQDAKENLALASKSPARPIKRTKEEPIVKMTAKAIAQAADQKAKQKASELLGSAIAPPIARRLRSRAI